MKVYIGPYLTWWGPFQIADLLRYVGVSKDKCHDIGSWLSDTWVGTLCEWVHGKRERTKKIRIDKYDVWGMDHTLALLIVPLLKKLKDVKHGSPFIDDEDVPEHIRSTSSKIPFDPSAGESDEFFHDRWTWVIEEMIWAFEQIVDEDSEAQYFENGYDRDGLKAHYDRIKRGTTMFGKYYQALWD